MLRQTMLMGKKYLIKKGQKNRKAKKVNSKIGE